MQKGIILSKAGGHSAAWSCGKEFDEVLNTH